MPHGPARHVAGTHNLIEQVNLQAVPAGVDVPLAAAEEDGRRRPQRKLFAVNRDRAADLGVLDELVRHTPDR